MNLSTENLYFIVPLEGTTKDILTKFEDEIVKSDELVTEGFQEIGVEVNRENSQILCQSGTSKFLGINIKGLKMDKKWKNVQEDFWVPRKNKFPEMNKLKDVLNMQFPSDTLKSMRLLNVESVDPSLEDVYNNLNIIYIDEEYMYFACSKKFFNRYGSNFPNDFCMVDMEFVTNRVHNYSVKMVFEALDTGEYSNLEITKFNNQFLLNIINHPVDEVHINMESNGTCSNVKVRVASLTIQHEFSTNKINVSGIIDLVKDQIDGKKCVISYDSERSHKDNMGIKVKYLDPLPEKEKVEDSECNCPPDSCFCNHCANKTESTESKLIKVEGSVGEISSAEDQSN